MPWRRFSRRRAGAQARHGERGRIVDEERQALDLLAGLDDAAEVDIAHLAAPEPVRRDLGLLGEDPRRELLGRHLEGEEGDPGAVGRPFALRLLSAFAEARGGVEGDVGGERGLAHAGAAGEDHQVGGVQPAQQAVEVVEAGGRAGERGVALVGVLDDLDGARQRRGELLAAGIDAAFLGELVEPVLGLLDLLGRRLLQGAVVGVVHHPLADADERAAQRQVLDGAAVVLGVDDGDGGAREAGQVLPPAGLGQRLVALEEVLQRDGVGDLAALDHVQHGAVDAAVHRQEEVLRQQEGARPGSRPRC